MDLCQIRSVTLFCRIKKSLIRNVLARVFVQLCKQLTLQVVRLAVAGEGCLLYHRWERCCLTVNTNPNTAPLSVTERLIQAA